MVFRDRNVKVALGIVLLFSGWTALVPAAKAGVSLHAKNRSGGKVRRENRGAKRQVAALEEQWRVAQLNGDAAAMEKLLAEDYIGINAGGAVFTKGQQLERLRNRAPGALTALTMSDTKVKLIGSTAIVTSLAQVQGTGGPGNGFYRYTRVYEHLASGGWRITNFEATRIPLGKRRDREAKAKIDVPD